MVLCFFILLFVFGNTSPISQYLEERRNLVEADESHYFDAHVHLDEQEKKVDQYLRRVIENEVIKYGAHTRFISTRPFNEIKDEIENSLLYKILHSMPKGGILHSHAIGNARDLIQHTYRTDCWINVGMLSPIVIFFYALGISVGDILNSSFTYLKSLPYQPPGVHWERVVDLRNNCTNITQFDNWLWELTQFRRPGYDVSEKVMWDYFDDTISMYNRIDSTLLHYLIPPFLEY
jgi:hypothetical protein